MEMDQSCKYARWILHFYISSMVISVLDYLRYFCLICTVDNGRVVRTFSKMQNTVQLKPMCQFLLVLNRLCIICLDWEDRATLRFSLCFVAKGSQGLSLTVRSDLYFLIDNNLFSYKCDNLWPIIFPTNKLNRTGDMAKIIK